MLSRSEFRRSWIAPNVERSPLVATSLRLVAELHPVHRRRMLGRVEKAARSAVNGRVRRGCGGLRQPAVARTAAATERPRSSRERSSSLPPARAGRDVRVARPRPDAVLGVEGGGVGRLREAEELQVRLRRASDRLLLVAGRTGDDSCIDRIPLHVLAADAVHRADLAAEGGVAGVDRVVVEEVRDLRPGSPFQATSGVPPMSGRRRLRRRARSPCRR